MEVLREKRVQVRIRVYFWGIFIRKILEEKEQLRERRGRQSEQKKSRKLEGFRFKEKELIILKDREFKEDRLKKVINIAIKRLLIIIKGKWFKLGGENVYVVGGRYFF